MPIDYSKFDKLEDSDDDKEQEQVSDAGYGSAVAPIVEAANMSQTGSTCAGVAATAPPAVSVEPSEDVVELVTAARYGDNEDVQAFLNARVSVDAYSHGGA